MVVSATAVAPEVRSGPRKETARGSLLEASACVRNGGLSAGPRTRPNNNENAQIPAVASVVTFWAVGAVRSATASALVMPTETARTRGTMATSATIRVM